MGNINNWRRRRLLLMPATPSSHAAASQTTGSFRHCAQTLSLQQHKTVFLQRFPSVFYKHRQLTTLLIDVLCLSVARSFSRCAKMDFYPLLGARMEGSFRFSRNVGNQ